MITEIMNTLKQELMVVKQLIERDNVYDICHSDEVDFIFGIDYMIVLDDSYFYINLGSELFPNIDFEKIRYIAKHCLIKNNNKYNKNTYIDTKLGEYVTTDETQHDIDILAEFNLSVINEIDTGCYD